MVGILLGFFAVRMAYFQGRAVSFRECKGLLFEDDFPFLPPGGIRTCCQEGVGEMMVFRMVLV